MADVAASVLGRLKNGAKEGGRRDLKQQPPVIEMNWS